MIKHTKYGKDLEIGKLYYPTDLSKKHKQLLKSQIYLCIGKDEEMIWLYNIESGNRHDIYGLSKLVMQELTE